MINETFAVYRLINRKEASGAISEQGGPLSSAGGGNRLGPTLGF